ncbi:MAG: ATP-dependent Clp protease adapter ClpS [Bdellovibrionia bacterium]
MEILKTAQCTLGWDCDISGSIAGGGPGGSTGGNANSNANDNEGDAVIQVSRPKLKEPARFMVILHNDDYTTMEFVIEVLRRFFHKSEEESVQIMLQVHQNGKGTAGVYSFEIAETKAMQVGEYSRVKGHPLQCSVEPAP